MHKFNFLDWIVILLVIIGGLNWGLVGLFGFNLVEYLFGYMSIISRIVYIVVGLAAIYMIFLMGKHCKCHKPAEK